MGDRDILMSMTGVPLSHLNLATSMHNIIGTYELTPVDRTLLVMPLFHVHGLVCGLLATLLSGGAAVIPQKFSASHFWNDFTEQKCNWYTAGKGFFFFWQGIAKGKGIYRNG